MAAWLFFRNMLGLVIQQDFRWNTGNSSALVISNITIHSEGDFMAILKVLVITQTNGHSWNNYNTCIRMTSSSRAVIATSMALHTSSLSKLQSLNGIFAIYKKQGPTSADVLNTLKKVLLTGRRVFNVCSFKGISRFILSSRCPSFALGN